MEINIVQPLYQQVYREFKKLILTGQILPGEKIVMSQLAEKYKISRTPLREALRQLQTEGLIVQDHTSMKVVELNKSDFLELFHCRLLLEKEVIRMIVTEITEDELAKVYEVLLESKKAIEAGDTFKILELNTQFHELLIMSCSNQQLAHLLNHVRSLLLIYRANINKKPQYYQEIYHEHMEIYKTVKSRDVEQSIKVIENHLLNDQKRGLTISE
ncbi:GntR family transcriptional regulator [Metabacillus arenae]|uniref:GntR family transcriptional regulator n=1 Tax=Metabacillus arenae TaxID=2771434 RepID=A0A926NH08_9BACI|nr:GntR family transcriptional regulator [Metabacillus arenae]MBD1380920.1 GntR family transcriptional regulator [Metabacillus arenae]